MTDEKKKTLTTEEVCKAVRLGSENREYLSTYNAMARAKLVDGALLIAEERDALAAKLDYATTWGNELAAEVARLREVIAALVEEREALREKAAKVRAEWDDYRADWLALDDLLKPEPITKTDQTRLAGNSVCPQVAEAIVGIVARGVLRSEP